MPTISSDGRWRWTGIQWIGVHSRARTPRWVIRDGLVWLALFVAWIPVLSALLLNNASSTLDIAIGGSLGSVALLATLIYGGLLGRHRRWRDVGFATLAGTAALVVCYVVLMVSAPDPNNTNDIGAGAGLAIFGLPTLLLVGMLLGLGAAVGRVTRTIGAGPLR
jgi:drug/metabolite transporter (DMT)-like permease